MTAAIALGIEGTVPGKTPYATDPDNGKTETRVEMAIIDSAAYSNSPRGLGGRAYFPHARFHYPRRSTP